ncbi:MAG: hypothetical protein L0G99_16865, partial [Propionibacteriales bacterium]|nr:hypothetical protein [Propionibacteriales bacterium]
GSPRPADSTPSTSVPTPGVTSSAPSSAASGSTPSGNSRQSTGAELDSLTGSFAALERRLHARLGLAIAPVGGGRAQRLGRVSGGPAWSTAKVPLARAALAGRPSDQTRPLIRRALRNSDNAAAESLWSGLGSDRVAAGQVTQVLRLAGDRRTTIPSRRARDNFSIVGQTTWELTDQAAYGGTLACLPRTDPVRDDMRHVRADLQWGLGRLDAAEFKGGWGPGADGRYLVRQFGTVRLPDGGMAAIAIAAIGTDGSYASGTAALDELADWAEQHLSAPTPTPC